MCSHTVWHQHFTLQATFTHSTIAAYEVRLVTCSQHCLLNANSLTALLGRPGLTSWFDGHLREAKFEFLADETQQRFNMLIIKWETLSRLIIPQMLFQVIHLCDLQEYRYNANSAVEKSNSRREPSPAWVTRPGLCYFPASEQWMENIYAWMRDGLCQLLGQKRK